MKMRITLLLSLLLSTLLVNAQPEQGRVISGGRVITDDPIAQGIASYYHDKFVGRQTSTGEIFDNNKYTAASNTLSLNTYVKVTNLSNGEFIYVRINDRMHKSNKRLIDMASICAKELGYHYDGLAKVKVEVVSQKEGKKGILAQNESRKRHHQPTDNDL